MDRNMKMRLTGLLLLLLVIIPMTISENNEVAATNPVNTLASNIQLPPKITGFETFQEGDMVFFRLFFTDPNNDAEGFGFRGVKGSRWGEETHPFKNDPSKLGLTRLPLSN